MPDDSRHPGSGMAGLYRAVWRVTGRQQLLLIGLSVLVAALAAAPLKFQQLVGNSLVYGGDFRRLAWLCASFLGAVLVSAALKFVLGLCSSAAGWCSRAAATSARSWRA